MRYKFKDDDTICSGNPKHGSMLTQFVWFVKWGDPLYNFHRSVSLFKLPESFTCWKLDVAKSKVVLGLYK